MTIVSLGFTSSPKVYHRRRAFIVGLIERKPLRERERERKRKANKMSVKLILYTVLQANVVIL
jgi:hypothetical protein